jgi:hypothetical protein
MTSDHVVLRSSPQARVLRLRELNGFDERSVDDISTDTAIRLLDALVCADTAGSAVQSVADLTASDRDRLLAAVYKAAFGDSIESTLTCRRCGNRFELQFSLAELLATIERNHDGLEADRYPDDTYRLPGTPRFRLPTGHDERAVAILPFAEAERELLRRCVVDGPAENPEAVQEALGRVAPLIDVDLVARCVECGAEHAVHFDIQSYLLLALANGHRRLIVDVHRLAAAFHWNLGEILSLPRGDRRALVDLVETDVPRRGRRT